MGNLYKDYYIILEVHYLASQAIIKSSYKQLSKIYHPDIGGNVEKFHEIQEAYEVLSNPILRKKYEEKWLQYHSKFMNHLATVTEPCLFDMFFLRARKSILEYMFFVLNKDYESAYEILSDYNKKKIDKIEYIRWQSLIGEIHQLLEFDCFIDTIHSNNQQKNDMSLNEKILVFKVKIIEKNLLLNRIEEEIFLRKLIYENNMWRIRLNDLDIKKIIKKYKRIIVLNSKNSKRLEMMRLCIEDYYPTQQLNYEVFVKCCECEFSRFVRYHNPFVILKIQLDSKITQKKLDQQVYDLLEKNTRKIDSFAKYDSYCYLLILPETDILKGKLVSEKISKKIETDIGDSKCVICKIKIATCEDKNVSINEILEKLIILDES